KNKHSYEHFVEACFLVAASALLTSPLQTKHTYALELESQRVWDYTRDAYVHRLATNKHDGKLVELAPPDLEMDRANTLKATEEDLAKVDALELEWQWLLQAHLDSQQLFFEERLAEVEKDKVAKLSSLEAEYAELLSQRIEAAQRLEAIERQK